MEFTRAIEPARSLATKGLILERTLSDLVNEAYGLPPGGGRTHVESRSAPHVHPAARQMIISLASATGHPLLHKMRHSEPSWPQALEGARRHPRLPQRAGCGNGRCYHFDIWQRY